jgi:hypothetical protein
MPRLDPGIHSAIVLVLGTAKRMDRRVKNGHEDK